MVQIRCEKCSYKQKRYCIKLNHPLENGCAMLWHGGAIGNYGLNGKITYPARCGIKDSEIQKYE